LYNADSARRAAGANAWAAARTRWQEPSFAADRASGGASGILIAAPARTAHGIAETGRVTLGAPAHRPAYTTTALQANITAYEAALPVGRAFLVFASTIDTLVRRTALFTAANLTFRTAL
jgi:hypothetical protein